MKLLLRHGARTEPANHEGDTALTLASAAGAAGSVGQLLAAPGAMRDAAWANAKGETAVFLAAKGNHLPTLDALLGSDTPTPKQPLAHDCCSPTV